MNYEAYVELMLLLDDIDEIVNQCLWYLYSPKSINEFDELFYAIKSVPERVADIKRIVETELVENESYFESQDESQGI